MRQVVLDTETTGLDPVEGHRIIEIGCVEIVNRRRTGRKYQQYLCPDRPIDPGAAEVHGLTDEFLRDKPRFEDVAADLTEFLRDAELVIHNAPFDVGFLNAELARLATGATKIESSCTITDTLVLARQLHPGQRNSLDALCRRYGVDNSQRDLHGALLDAEILADVYLAMTGGQADLMLDRETAAPEALALSRLQSGPRARRLIVQLPDAEERARHAERLAEIDSVSGGACLWLALERADTGERTEAG